MHLVSVNNESALPESPQTFSWAYRKLGKFVYHVLTNREEITAMLRYWVGREWADDVNDSPGAHWIPDWMHLLASQKFELVEVDFERIAPNAQLMTYQFDGYSFAASLARRATEREMSILRGMSIEPLMIRGDTHELLDGYTRYEVLRRHQQTRVFAYSSTVDA